MSFLLIRAFFGNMVKSVFSWLDHASVWINTVLPQPPIARPPTWTSEDLPNALQANRLSIYFLGGSGEGQGGLLDPQAPILAPHTSHGYCESSSSSVVWLSPNDNFPENSRRSNLSCPRSFPLAAFPCRLENYQKTLSTSHKRVFPSPRIGDSLYSWGYGTWQSCPAKSHTLASLTFHGSPAASLFRDTHGCKILLHGGKEGAHLDKIAASRLRSETTFPAFFAYISSGQKRPKNQEQMVTR